MCTDGATDGWLLAVIGQSYGVVINRIPRACCWCLQCDIITSHERYYLWPLSLCLVSLCLVSLCHYVWCPCDLFLVSCVSVSCVPVSCVPVSCVPVSCVIVSCVIVSCVIVSCVIVSLCPCVLCPCVSCPCVPVYCVTVCRVPVPVCLLMRLVMWVAVKDEKKLYLFISLLWCVHLL